MSEKLWSKREKAFRLELKMMRKAAGLSQVELAQKLEVHQSFISKYENGERQLRFLEIETLCIACGTSLHSFAKAFNDKHPIEKEAKGLVDGS